MNAVTIHVQGMTYGTQNSVFETGIDDSLCLPIAMLRHDSKAVGHVMEVVSCAEDAVNALAEYVVNLQIAAGSQASKASVQAYKNTVREAAYARLDLLFRNRLAGFAEDKDVTAYSNAWKNEIHRILLTISDEYAGQSQVSAFQEHESKGMVMSAARALSMFRGRLNSVLGSLPTEARNAQRGE
ncbi:type I-E CRISPR-associated protein Cse1/CasA [Bifidobacterium panos]|uniref:CRISPR-associated protein, Cse1 family n=1 Tax=Bifidobacterium panos TaxID=2675321 RepID=A0ABX1SYP9_9BIFI|nr:type I-E CRISPR-associated protein Cse1/CasA [Bifidobacterium sp. DSM 109963]NMN01739.1 CRISPR-associated protein, Cse1 family [Bifidobacterium sp. DSM 109963]